jgi:hypothetical protein
VAAPAPFVTDDPHRGGDERRPVTDRVTAVMQMV